MALQMRRMPIVTTEVKVGFHILTIGKRYLLFNRTGWYLDELAKDGIRIWYSAE